MAYMLLLTNMSATRDFLVGKKCSRLKASCKVIHVIVWEMMLLSTWSHAILLMVTAIQCTALYSPFVMLLAYKDAWLSCMRSSCSILRFHVLIDRSGLLETLGKRSSFVVERAMKCHGWTE